MYSSSEWSTASVAAGLHDTLLHQALLSPYLQPWREAALQAATLRCHVPCTPIKYVSFGLH